MRYRDGAVRPSPVGLPAPDRDLRAGRMEHQSLVSEPDASTRRSTAGSMHFRQGVPSCSLGGRADAERR